MITVASPAEVEVSACREGLVFLNLSPSPARKEGAQAQCRWAQIGSTVGVIGFKGHDQMIPGPVQQLEFKSQLNNE